MQKNIDDVSLKAYIDIYQLTKLSNQTHEENRHFGLSHKKLLDSPLKLLGEWRRSKLHLLPHPSSSYHITQLLSSVTTALATLFFIFGIFSGMGLLYYNGSQPINLLYFLAMVLFLPLGSMVVTTLAILSANSSHNLLIHISPAYWLEQIILRLPRKFQKRISAVEYNPLIGNYLIIKRSQLLGLLFSLGIFLALLGTIITQDIAFSWSTTLHITPKELYDFFYIVAFPWREFLPTALPSLELIESSQYFRLGGKLDDNLLDNATLLGEWWKFLAMTTLIYAIVLRLVFLAIASQLLRKAIESSILLISGVRELLDQMQEPIVTTQSHTTEIPLEESKERVVESTTLEKQYSFVIGWAMLTQDIEIHNEREAISTQKIYQAGGANSLEEDEKIIEEVSNSILVYVKSWEPPTMDFIDFLEDISRDNRTITLYPIGTVEHNYKASTEEFNIWERKVSILKDSTIRMKQ